MLDTAQSFILALIIGVSGVVYIFWPVLKEFIKERLSNDKANKQ